MEDQDLLEIGILNSGHRQRIPTGNPAPSKGKTAFIILAFSLVPVVLSPGVQSVLVFRTICVYIDTIP